MEGNQPSSDDVLDFLFDDSYGLLNDATANFDPKQSLMNPVENIEFPKLDLVSFVLMICQLILFLTFNEFKYKAKAF